MKQERLDFLATNTRYTRRFVRDVGRRCREASIKHVARELHLDWHTVKELDKEYMQEQLSRTGKPRPKAVGIDEVSIRKGQQYRVVVGDRSGLTGRTGAMPAWRGSTNGLGLSGALGLSWR